MDNLPEIIQDKINLNIHELKFVDTLNVVKQLFGDHIELMPDEDTNTISPTDISQSDAETYFSSVESCDLFTHNNNIEMKCYIGFRLSCRSQSRKTSSTTCLVKQLVRTMK